MKSDDEPQTNCTHRNRIYSTVALSNNRKATSTGHKSVQAHHNQSHNGLLEWMDIHSFLSTLALFYVYRLGDCQRNPRPTPIRPCATAKKRRNRRPRTTALEKNLRPWNASGGFRGVLGGKCGNRVVRGGDMRRVSGSRRRPGTGR